MGFKEVGWGVGNNSVGFNRWGNHGERGNEDGKADRDGVQMYIYKYWGKVAYIKNNFTLLLWFASTSTQNSGIVKLYLSTEFFIR